MTIGAHRWLTTVPRPPLERAAFSAEAGAGEVVVEVAGCASATPISTTTTTTTACAPTSRCRSRSAFDARALGNWGCPPELYPAALDLALDGKVRLAPFVEIHPLDDIDRVFHAVQRARSCAARCWCPERNPHECSGTAAAARVQEPRPRRPHRAPGRKGREARNAREGYAPWLTPHRR
jgi:hypothetical protein